MALSAHNKTEIVKQLVSVGADIEMQDLRGKKAFDIASEAENNETAAFLHSLASGVPMEQGEQEVHLRNLLESVLGAELNGMNSKEHVVHNNYRMWSAVPSVTCQISATGNSWGINVNNIYCAKDCAGVDAGTGLPYVNKIGMVRTLEEKAGFRWQDADGEVISSVRCLVGDVGGFEVVGYEEYHNLVDIDECAENMELCKPLGDCVNIVGSYTCNCTYGVVVSGQDGPNTTCLSEGGHYTLSI